MCAWQKPSKSHPWRQYTNYANRVNPTDETKKEKKQKTVKILITEFAESWDEMRIVTTVYGREGEFRLAELPQSKQAAWLASLLKRHYA